MSKMARMARRGAAGPVHGEIGSVQRRGTTRQTRPQTALIPGPDRPTSVVRYPSPVVKVALVVVYQIVW